MKDISVPQEAGHIKNTVSSFDFPAHPMFPFDELWVAWVLVSSEIQVQPQIILHSDYLPHYLSVSYDYVSTFI